MDGPEAPLVRVHVADTLRDALGITGDGRTWTLRRALERVAAAPNGVVVILREAEAANDLGVALQALQRHAPGPRMTRRQSRQLGTRRRWCCAPSAWAPRSSRTWACAACGCMSQPKQMHGLSAFGLTVESYLGADS